MFSPGGKSLNWELGNYENVPDKHTNSYFMNIDFYLPPLWGRHGLYQSEASPGPVGDRGVKMSQETGTFLWKNNKC